MTTEAFEAEFSIEGLQEVERELRSLEEGLTDTGKAAEKSGESTSSFAQSWTAGLLTVQAAAAGIIALYTGLRDLAAGLERTSGVLAAFSGNVDEAIRRTGGMISSFDLMLAKNTAVAAGLELTDDQFATLAVRATEFAQATGGDATEGFQNLIRALGEGPDALKAMGVSVEGATGLLDQQTRALAQLTEDYGDATVEANTLGGAMRALENRADNTLVSFQDALEGTGMLDRGMENLRGTVDDVVSSFGFLTSGDDSALSMIDVFAIKAGAAFTLLTERLDTMVTAVRRMQDMTAALIDGDFARVGTLVDEQSAALDGFLTGASARRDELEAEAAANLGTARGERLGRDAGNVAQGGPRAQGGRSGGSTPSDDTKAMVIAQYAKDQERISRELQSQIELSGRLKDAEGAREDAAQNALTAERGRAEAMAAQTREFLAQEKLRQTAISDEDRRIGLERKAARAQSAVTEGLEGVADIARQTIQLTEDGAMSTKQAFVTAIDEWLKQFAIQEAWKGVADLASAIGASFSNPADAGAKYASAAMHFGIAAAAGGASAAIPAQGGGSGSGASSGASRPDAASGSSSGGGGTVVINYNSPVAEANIGREQGRAGRAAQRRFG